MSKRRAVKTFGGGRGSGGVALLIIIIIIIIIVVVVVVIIIYYIIIIIINIIILLLLLCLLTTNALILPDAGDNEVFFVALHRLLESNFLISRGSRVSLLHCGQAQCPAGDARY